MSKSKSGSYLVGTCQSLEVAPNLLTKTKAYKWYFIYWPVCKPYQLNRLIKIMVANLHSIFHHMLVGFSIHIAGEGNVILFSNSHHRYLKIGGVEFVHIGDISVPLVEGVLAVNN